MPILTLELAKQLRTTYRITGVKLAMTNGVFDVLHRGHVEYLERAAAHGDKLWVAINSDASVRRLKGEKRPLVTWEDRAALVAALRCVDGVLSFDEETPLELYKTLLPDVLAKGADYAVHQIAGAKEVLAAGGKVELIELVPERSTTNLVDLILQRYGK
jgi:D-beta-D-heptose 7-phosphate kinase / D-beta-D-heptose 1-phosphate adenosyltransferase